MNAESRRQRQRQAILAAAAVGDGPRATALLAEHAIEFPEDGHLLEPVPVRADRPNPPASQPVAVRDEEKESP